MAEAGIIRKRASYEGDLVIRKMINNGGVLYRDAHLSKNAEMIRQGIIGPIDFAIIEATAIKEEGLLIPTTSVGNSPIIVKMAKEIIIELNVSQPNILEGMHDIYETNWNYMDSIRSYKSARYRSFRNSRCPFYYSSAL